MNYYKALERANHSGWHFTVTNNGIARTHACCIGCEPPHKTKEEAEACFHKYLLDRLKLDGKLHGTQQKCAECGEWTQGYAETDCGTLIFLCDKHRTREIYEKLWTPPTEIMSSY